jgi:hypothetical protein
MNSCPRCSTSWPWRATPPTPSPCWWTATSPPAHAWWIWWRRKPVSPWTSPSPRDGGDALAKPGLDGPAGLDRLQRLRQAMSAYRRQGLLRAGRTAGGAAARRRVTWQTSPEGMRAANDHWQKVCRHAPMGAGAWSFLRWRGPLGFASRCATASGRTPGTRCGKASSNSRPPPPPASTGPTARHAERHANLHLAAQMPASPPGHPHCAFGHGRHRPKG